MWHKVSKCTIIEMLGDQSLNYNFVYMKDYELFGPEELWLENLGHLFYYIF